MTKPNFNLLFREKPAKLLMALVNSPIEMYASTVAKKIDCTYSHIVKILQEMEENALVTFRRKGRLKMITLTKKGEEIARNINLIDKLIK